MPKQSSKISDTTLVEIIAKRLLGESQLDIAKEYGISTQAIQYYEAKETSQDLKKIVLHKIAKTVGGAFGIPSPPANENSIRHICDSYPRLLQRTHGARILRH